MFPTNVHGMHLNAENKSEAECTTKDYDHSNDVNVVRDKTNIIEETTSLQDENILAREGEFINFIIIFVFKNELCEKIINNVIFIFFFF